MEPKFNTSFIPKKSLQDVGGNTGGRYVGRRDVYGPGFYLSLLVFLVAVVATVGLFAYSKIIEKSIEEKITLLEAKKAVFSSEDIVALIRADTQIKNAHRLVLEHVTLSELFNHLEKITLKRVQYTGLEYAGFPNEVGLVTLSGNAKNFQDVALQTEQYRTDTNMRNPIVRELERDKEEDVSFSIDVLTNIEFLSFASMLSRNSAGNPEASQVWEEVPSNDQNAPVMENIPLNAPTDTQGTMIEVGGNNPATVETTQPPVINTNDTGAFVNTF
jgi:hypothetical protein